MSVPEQIPTVSYTANGTTTNFPITFELSDERYLVVTKNMEIPPVGAYTILNGNVIFGVAPNEGDIITLMRDTVLDRETNYQNYDNSFRPEAVNYDLDKIWHVLQEQNLIDAKLLARVKEEIEWRRTHNANFDLLAQMRENNLAQELVGYINTLIGMSNPNIFDGIKARMVVVSDTETQEDVNLQFKAIESSAVTVPDNVRSGALGGAIRVDSEGIPFVINDVNHLGFGLTGVEVGATQYDLKVKYEHTFSKVGTLTATCDETLAAYMLNIGGSVGANFADLKIVAPLYFTMRGNIITGISPLWSDYVSVADSSANHVTLSTPQKADGFFQPQVTSKNDSANTYKYCDLTAYSTPTALKISAWKQDKASCRINYNGSSFSVSMSNVAGVSATVAGNQITITHPPALASSAMSGRVLQAFASNYRYVVAAVTSTTTLLYVYDAAGAALTTMDTNVSFGFEFSALDQVTTLANIADREISVFAGYYYVPIAALGKISGGNLWINGAMLY